MQEQNAIRKILASDRVNDQTRQVLLGRLNTAPKQEPEFFSIYEMLTLKAVADRLLPQDDNEHKIDLAGIFDSALKCGRGDGWRYDDMPPDETSFKDGLRAVDSMAANTFQKAFTHLAAKEQDELLHAIKKGFVASEDWKGLSSRRFFEELLVALTEIYYSHPLGRLQIGDLSFADAKGWLHVEPGAHQEDRIDN